MPEGVYTSPAGKVHVVGEWQEQQRARGTVLDGREYQCINDEPGERKERGEKRKGKRSGGIEKWKLCFQGNLLKEQQYTRI